MVGGMRGQVNELRGYCSFAYSALASFRMGMSGSDGNRTVSLTATPDQGHRFPGCSCPPHEDW